MIPERLPEVANQVTDQLANGQNLDGCLKELASASERLDRHGFVGRPSWADTGGRLSQEAVEFVDALAVAKARDSLPVLRRSAHLAWRRRWMRMLAISCGRSFTASLVAGPSDKKKGSGQSDAFPHSGHVAQLKDQVIAVSRGRGLSLQRLVGDRVEFPMEFEMPQSVMKSFNGC